VDNPTLPLRDGALMALSVLLFSKGGLHMSSTRMLDKQSVIDYKDEGDGRWNKMHGSSMREWLIGSSILI